MEGILSRIVLDCPLPLESKSSTLPFNFTPQSELIANKRNLISPLLVIPNRDFTIFAISFNISSIIQRNDKLELNPSLFPFQDFSFYSKG